MSLLPALLRAALLLGLVATTVAQPVPGNKWDLLLLVRVWPGAAGLPFPSAIMNWQIHGLWPQNNDGTWPQFCDANQPFDSNKVADLLSELNENWQNGFAPGNSTSLWAHEWDKHGTCAATLPALNSQHAYFSSALRMDDEYNITETLAKANVLPGRSYSIDQISEPLKAAFGADPVLNCIKSGGKTLLQQVYLCVNKTLSVYECNAVVTRGIVNEGPCPTSGAVIYYPPIKH